MSALQLSKSHENGPTCAEPTCGNKGTHYLLIAGYPVLSDEARIEQREFLCGKHARQQERIFNEALYGAGRAAA